MNSRIVLSLFAAACLFLVSCSSEAPPAEAEPAAADQASANPDQALIEQLVLMNRMLSSKEMAVLGAYGHVSARSRTNPNRYFISAAVSPALVTAQDIYESDLENAPAGGSRTDMLDERFIHGEIYKARPDVNAIVYTNVPQLVAFSISSVPLPRQNGRVPVFDIRRAEGGQNGVINTPALGKALADALGMGNSILTFGHGAVIASPTTNNAVSQALGLRMAADDKMFELALGGQMNHMVFTRETAIPEAGSAENTGPSGRVGRIDRFAAFFNFMGARDLSRTPGRSSAAHADPNSDQAVIEDLVIANRLLASSEIGVLTPDGLAHVSVRSRTNPERFFIAHDVSPGMVTPAHIIENNLDAVPVSAENVPQYSERYIHSEFYRARPDIMAIVHAHTPELRTFGISSVKLRPVLNSALFMRDGLPIYDISKFTGGAPSPVSCAHCISTPQLGKSMAMVIGDAEGSLLREHGITLGAPSARALVARAYALKMNAKIQEMAIGLGGTVNAFDGTGKPADRASYPEWDYWKHVVLGSLDINTAFAPPNGLPTDSRD
jgi:HCOMODA/2-hydroxy-3-carboxy-muconic semialdehyde decarboxylase